MPSALRPPSASSVHFRRTSPQPASPPSSSPANGPANGGAQKFPIRGGPSPSRKSFDGATKSTQRARLDVLTPLLYIFSQGTKPSISLPQTFVSSSHSPPSRFLAPADKLRTLRRSSNSGCCRPVNCNHPAPGFESVRRLARLVAWAAGTRPRAHLHVQDASRTPSTPADDDEHHVPRGQRGAQEQRGAAEESQWHPAALAPALVRREQGQAGGALHRRQQPGRRSPEQG